MDELEVTLRSAVHFFAGTPVTPVSAARTATRCKQKEVLTSIITSHPGTICFRTTSPAASASSASVSASPVHTASPAARPLPARSPTHSSESSAPCEPVVRRNR